MPLAFFGTFFRFERKYYPPRDGSPTVRAVVGASIPTRGRGMRLRAHQRAFRSPFGNLRAPKLVRNPWDTKSHSPARVDAPSPQQRIFLRHSCRTPMQAGGFPRGKRSARIALPCALLVGYLNFRLLSAIGSHTRRVHDFLRLPRRKYQQPRHGGAPSIPQPLFPKRKPSAP